MTEAVAASQPEVLRLLEGLRAQAGELVAAGERAWALRAVEKARALEGLAAARRTLDAAHLGLVRSLSHADAAALGAASPAALVSWRLNLPPGRAKADVEAARVTDPERGELRALGAALAAGEVSVGHVDVARRALDQLPVALRREHAAGIDAFVAEHARTSRPGEVEHLAGRVLDTIDPSRADRGFDPDDHARRFFDLTPDSTGMFLARGQLDPVTGAKLKAALDRYCAPVPATDADRADGQGQIRVVDDRTPGQRRADALGTIADQACASGGTRRGEPTRVIVVATTAQAAGTPGAGRAWCEQTGTTVSAVVTRRLRCDAALSAVLLAPNGAVLRMGRTVRCATPAQRRALYARDGGCVIPGCTAPAAQLEAHHVTAWAAGGLTDVDAMVLACGPHHTMVELGTWGVRMVDGLPQVRAPRWTNPEDHWVHLPRRTAERAATTLGEQLTLDTTALDATDSTTPDHSAPHPQPPEPPASPDPPPP